MALIPSVDDELVLHWHAQFADMVSGPDGKPQDEASQAMLGAALAARVVAVGARALSRELYLMAQRCCAVADDEDAAKLASSH